MKVEFIENANNIGDLCAGLRKALGARALLVIVVQDAGENTVETSSACIFGKQSVEDERVTLDALSDRLVEALQRAALSRVHGLDHTSTRPPPGATSPAEAGN
jgi:hypothetical protein